MTKNKSEVDGGNKFHGCKLMPICSSWTWRSAKDKGGDYLGI